MKKITLILLVLLLAIPAFAMAAPEYDVTLPADYDSGLHRYPVLYVLPQDGYHADDSGLTEALLAAPGLPVLVVRPRFAEGEDPAETLRQVIADVDAQYRTVADPAHRAAVGTGVGGYLAYALTLSEDSGIEIAVSIRGNFVGEDNPWRAALGDVKERIEALHQQDANIFNSYYTYMDAPVDDVWTDLPGSTDDLGSLMIGYGTGSAFHEFTVRPGVYDEAFLAESARRVMARLTARALGSLASGSMTLDKTVLAAEDEGLTAEYALTVTEAVSAFTGGELPAQVKLVLADAAGTILAQAEEEIKLNGAGQYTGSLTVANALTDQAEARLSITLLGSDLSLATAPVSRAKSDRIEGDWQEISLAGDWYFNYVGAQTQLDATALTPADFADWSVVQPGLASWTKGFGNISNENVTSGYGPDYFDFFIVGNAYYAKTFTLPEAFDTANPVLVIGYVDDRCEVFLNGVRVGGTGIDENGNSTGDTTWAVFSNFAVDPALLNRGSENTVIVRAYNDLPFGAGGWYGGPIGLFSQAAFDAQYGADSAARFYEETFESAYAASAQGQAGTVENQYLIYLPESYAASDRSYPTVYLLHQFNSDHTSYRTDAIDQLLDEGVQNGLFDEMIVVIPNSSEDSWWRGDWEKMITEELIPLIDGKYRTIQDARYRLTAGCSMGGQGAYGVALRNPDYFSGVVSFFGAFSYGGANSPNMISAQESAEYLRYFAHYFICGNQDNYGFGGPAIDLHQKLLAAEVPHRFFIDNGSHDSAFYLPFFQDAFRYIRANMYHADDKADALLTGSLTLEGTAITGQLTADPGIAAYMHSIPASSYTKDPSPALSIPLTLTVERDGETVYSFTERGVRVSPDALTADLQADLAEYLDQPATITLTASLFDRTVVLDTVEVAGK